MVIVRVTHAREVSRVPSQPLVSVIVPAFNAARTLGETLRSASAQTCRDIEIVVVDDGSTDGTCEIARQHAQDDDRILLIRTENRGVAAARNTAIAASRGTYVAPLDADDFWHPEKLARQVAAFEAAGPEAGLVYTWFRLIDGKGLVFAPSPTPRVEGVVLHRHLAWNFISNASSALIRRAILPREPYARALREAGNEGCEDFLLQLQIACRFRFACVPAFLTAYRKLPDSMSADTARMLRSRLQAFEILAPSLPRSAAPIVRREVARTNTKLAFCLLEGGEHATAIGAYRRALAGSPEVAARTAFYLLRKPGRPGPQMRETPGAEAGRRARPFASYAADEPFEGPRLPARATRETAALLRLDTIYQPAGM